MNSAFILLNGSGEAYNIADPNSVIMIRQLAEKLTKIGNCKIVMDLPSETEKNRYNPVTKSFFSVDKLQALGWNVSEGSNDKLGKTVDYLKSSLL